MGIFSGMSTSAWSRFLVVLGAFACVVGCGRSEGRSIQNVVLISLDTLRADHLEVYGYERPTAPFLREIGSRGVVFEQAIAQAPWTTPSHAAMLSSTYPSALGLGTFWEGRAIPEDAVLLAQVLRQAGMRTKGIVDGGLVSRWFGFQRGFESYEDSNKRMSTTVDLALHWIDGLEANRSFFLFLHTYDVHGYRHPKSTGLELVRPYDGPLLREPKLPRLLQNRQSRSIVERFAERDRRYVLDLYDAAIRLVDEQLRRLHRGFESRGLVDRTLFVVTSDHGEELFDRGHSGHGYTLFDENLRVPLLLVHPSLPVLRVTEPVRLLDLAPTILALLGLSPPDHWQGVSLTPFLFGDGPRLSAFSSHTHHTPAVSVRVGSMKLIRTGGEGATELYDLDADPFEGKNLAGQGLGAEAGLNAALDRWVRLTDSLRIGRAGDPVELGEDLRDQLRELGYLDDGED